MGLHALRGKLKMQVKAGKIAAARKTAQEALDKIRSEPRHLRRLAGVEAQLGREIIPEGLIRREFEQIQAKMPKAGYELGAKRVVPEVVEPKPEIPEAREVLGPIEKWTAAREAGEFRGRVEERAGKVIEKHRMPEKPPTPREKIELARKAA